MSEQWMGLHHPDRHEHHGGIADCLIETANPVMARWCTRDHPCRCCLAAEVEVLRAELDRYKRLLEQEHCPTCFGPCGGCDALDGGEE